MQFGIFVRYEEYAAKALNTNGVSQSVIPSIYMTQASLEREFYTRRLFW